MRHRVLEGNSSTMQIVDMLRSGILPDEERRPRNYRPQHRAVETSPLTDRPAPDTEEEEDVACDVYATLRCSPKREQCQAFCIRFGPQDPAPLDATAELEATA